MKSIPEEVLYNDLAEAGLLDGLEREYRFDPQRKFLSDFAYPADRLLIEVEGGTRSGGRHVRGDGYEVDCKKYNRAQLLGYRVLRYTTDMVASRQPVMDIREIRRL